MEIVKSTKPKMNKEQQKAADSRINTVVSAGAGSGKTMVLSERFTKLVTENHFGVDEILTLTFTKKATVEMSSRIYKVLKEKAPDKAADFYKANIKTLDGYCNSVAKMGAHLYGISPDFVQDDSITQRINQMALPFLLENRNNEALQQLIKTKSFEVIASELLVNPVIYYSTVTEPINYYECQAQQIAQILNVWESCSVESESLLTKIETEYETLKEFSDGAFIKNMRQLLEDTRRPDCPELNVDDVINENYTAAGIFVSFASSVAYLRLPSLKNSELMKEYMLELRDKVEILKSCINYIYGYKLTSQLIPLLEEFQNKANSLKRSTGKLTFKDIASLATCILRDYPDIRQIEKEKYKAIMIDEFQDNNQEQRDMLFMLAERLDLHKIGVPSVNDLCPDKLFFVGDEKQSIYKFRGADVSVFRALSKDFEKGNLSMASNHRSSQALIACFNTIFGGIPYPLSNNNEEIIPSVFFTEKDAEETIIPDYEPIYHKVTPFEDAIKEVEMAPDKAKFYQPAIHFAVYNKEQEAENLQLVEEEAEAEWVARKIKELLKGSENKPAYKPSDIAILIRSTPCQPLFERTLLTHGIPYNSETLTGFFSDGPVNDIFSFLRICIYSDDSLSYAQILRSPFVNLSVEETNSILIKNHKPFEYEGDDLLTDESLARYEKAKEFYLKIKELCQIETLTSLVTKLWYEAGYRYETIWNPTVKLYGKTYDLIFELARQAEEDCLSLAAFVDSVRMYQDSSAKVEGMDIPLESAEGVHILTIHKSKGLEYPVVFIVNSQGGSVNESNSSPIYVSKKYGLSINTPPYPGFDSKNYFYELTHQLEVSKASAELRRLVYVALTRAEKEIYITNAKYKKDDKAISKYGPGNKVSSIFNILEPIINYYNDDSYTDFVPFTFEEIPPYNRLAIKQETNNRPNLESEKLKLIEKINTNNLYDELKIAKLEVVESKYISPSHLHVEDEENSKIIIPSENVNQKFGIINDIIYQSIPKKFRGTDKGIPRFGYTDFGTIAHAYMEAAVKNEPVKIASKNLLGLENNKTKIQQVMNVCEEMKMLFQNSEIGKEAISADFKKAEYDFRSKVAGKIIRGQIDLLFKSEDGKYTILDYKTNSEIVPEIYYNQLACYRQAVAQMEGIKNPAEIRCCLFYLRHGETKDISSEVDKVNIEEAVKLCCE